MKRFLKVSVLLMIALFALVSGVDVTLSHMAKAETQSAFTYYDQKGQIIADYSGNLAYCPIDPKPHVVTPATILTHASFAPPSVD
ncbi:MAG TPA: hypothetical protein VL981_02900 [Candidatus Methylacidiphilales bacterium]|nr:hypothetical protein [Candidatus Methylacidiphilales bacterium]